MDSRLSVTLEKLSITLGCLTGMAGLIGAKASSNPEKLAFGLAGGIGFGLLGILVVLRYRVAK